MLKRCLAVTLVFCCLACATPAQAVKIGILPASDTLALHVAHEEGLFAKHGLNVELVPFQSALEQAAALRGGAIDGWFSDMIAVLVMHESGVPQTFFATMSYSGPGRRFFGIATAPGSSISDMDGLRGKKIAISQATIIDYMLSAILRGLNLADDYAERVDIRQISVRLQLLSAGKVDAALLPEPLLSLMEARGSRVIADNTDFEEPLAIMALKSDKADPKAVAAFQAALAEAMNRVNAEPERYREVMLAKKLLPAEAAASYRMLAYPPAHTPTPPPSAADVERVARWMFDNKLVRRMPDAAKTIYDGAN